MVYQAENGAKVERARPRQLQPMSAPGLPSVQSVHDSGVFTAHEQRRALNTTYLPSLLPPPFKQPALADHAPCEKYLMGAAERNILQLWLASRYRRSAFPDGFDRRLGKETGVAERLAKVFKDTGHCISTVFFDVDEGEEKMREGPEDPYELIVTLLYSTDSDPEQAEAQAAIAASAVKAVFESRCRTKQGDTTEWKWIELVAVEVLSEQALSYADSQKLTKWQADHISLREDPPQPLIG